MISFPLVSIVLPVYNGARYLEDAIKSCLAQTYEHLELIIVDDASTDETPDIALKYAQADRRVTVVRHEANRMLPAALNSGFEVANGEFFTWTSDDNLYRPETLAVLVDTLSGNPEISIAYSDFYLLDEIHGRNRPIFVGEPEQVPVSNCIGPCFLYRRVVHEALSGYDEGMYLAEDYDFWLRAYQKFKFQRVHRDLYVYRHHGKSLTSIKQTMILRTTARVRARFNASTPCLSGVIKARGWVHQVETAVNNREIGLALAYLVNALSAAPGYVLRHERRLFRRIAVTCLKRGV